MPFVTLATGERVFYAHKDNGAAKDVLFVHGAGGTHRIWGHQLQNLQAANTYAFDLPAHGRSEGAGRDAIPDYSQVVLQFMDAVGIERAILVGHSMGGAITLWTALTTPDRLRGIGLVGTGARLRVLPAILEGLRTDFEKAVELIGGFAYAPDAGQKLVDSGRQEWLANAPEVLYGDFLACDRFDVMGRLEEIRLPAAVIVGSEDRLTPVKYARYMADHLPDAELTIVEGAGHMVMVEQPAPVTQALQRLVDRCP